MSQTVGDFFWARFHDQGVRRIFGNPGDGINGWLASLRGSRIGGGLRQWFAR